MNENEQSGAQGSSGRRRRRPDHVYNEEETDFGLEIIYNYSLTTKQAASLMRAVFDYDFSPNNIKYIKEEYASKPENK